MAELKKTELICGYKIIFITNEIGFLTDGNSIYKTDNSGKTWKLLKSFSNNRLRLGISNKNIYFINNKVGHCIIDTNTLVETTDGGKNWNNLLTVPYYKRKIIAFHFVEESTGFIAIKTSNHKSKIYEIKNKDKILIATNNFIPSSMYFINENLGWIVGGNKILKLIKKESKWKKEYKYKINSNKNFDFIYFTDEKNGYIMDSSDRLFNSNDGGDTWEEIKIENKYKNYFNYNNSINSVNSFYNYDQKIHDIRRIKIFNCKNYKIVQSNQSSFIYEELE